MIVSSSFTRPANTTAYTSGDVVNGDTIVVPISFAINPNRVNPMATGLSIVSSNQTGTFTGNLHLFSGSFATAADNAAFNPSDADMASYYLGSMAVGAAWYAFSSNKASTTLLTLPVPLCTSDRVVSGYVYGVLVITSAYTPVSAEALTINLFVD